MLRLENRIFRKIFLAFFLFIASKVLATEPVRCIFSRAASAIGFYLSWLTTVPPKRSMQNLCPFSKQQNRVLLNGKLVVYCTIYSDLKS